MSYPAAKTIRMYKDPLIRPDQPELDVLRAAQGSLGAIADGIKSAGALPAGRQG
jgi:hypothetical protein